MGGMASISPPPKQRPFCGFIHSYTRWVYDKMQGIIKYMNYVQTINIYIFRLHDPRKRAIPFPQAQLARGAGRNISFVDFYPSFIIAQFQSCLYIYYINNSKKRVISLIKIFIMYIIIVHEMYDTNIYI